MQALENYLRELVNLEGKTVPETSRYGTLGDLLNVIGAGLRVKAIVHPANTGAGIPDLALFDDHQPAGQQPAHGIIEAKPINDDLMTIARSGQVERYTNHYGQTLVTNYYQFVLVTRGADEKPVIEEAYRMAENPKAFWEAVKQPRKLAEEHGAALTEYILRVMRRNAPLIEPRDVAWMLASYAREAKARTEAAESGLAALARVREQLEKALGLHFEDEAADEFFISTLVQTLFYGVFSAWVLWYESHHDPEREFDLWNDIRDVSLPAIQDLFEEVTKASVIRALNLKEVIDWTAKALNRVDKTAFFQRFERGDAVQYFYEPFLEQFDPELRRQLGVWYTPPEIVEYMVARVDAALRAELGIPDGLLAEQVVILDPCCGTGAYLIHVLRHIYNKLVDRRGKAQAGQDIKRIMATRVFGFEILPAPFIVAHLQIGMLLNSWDAPLAGSERAGVYLTNALTGWEKPETEPIALPGLQRERDAAENVKQQQPILVILGNPPYSGFAGTAIEEESSLVAPYRTTERAPAPQGQGLNDLYVRFFGMAERKIVGSTKRGIVCYISNYSWLDGLSHTGMRERYLNAFDSIYIDNLHGDRIISEYAPDGRTSETIFSIRGNSPGIRIGTAIALMVAKHQKDQVPTLYYRDMHQARADERRAALLESLSVQDFRSQYEKLKPAVEIGLPFKPRVVGTDYFAWPKLPELFPESFPGVKTSRDDVVVDVDRERLLERLKKYFDPNISHEQMRQIAPGAMESTARFEAERVRDYLIKRGFLPENVVRYSYRPFDTRWLYWEPETKLLDEKRPEYFPHVKPENLWIEARQRQTMDQFDRGMVTHALADNLGNGLSSYFPLYLYDPPKEATLLEPASPGGKRANLSEKAAAYLQEVGADETALFFHALAVLHSPAYRVENAGALRQDWPRLPLPAEREALIASAELGRQVAALLDIESPVNGITVGDTQPELKGIAVLEKAGGGAPDMNITAGWGHFGVGTAVMPGRGQSVTHEDGSLDIYLNDSTYWKNVPAAVWDYTLGDSLDANYRRASGA